MLAQGTELINTAQFGALQARVNSAGSCAELQAIATEVLASLAAETTAITQQMTALAPLAALLSPPSSPSDVLTWVSGFITHVLGPMYAPYATYAAQQSARALQITALTTAITQKAGSFADCSIAL